MNPSYKPSFSSSHSKSRRSPWTSATSRFQPRTYLYCVLAISVLILWFNHGPPERTSFKSPTMKPQAPATTQGSTAAPHRHIQHSPVAGSDNTHHQHTSQHHQYQEGGKLEQTPWAITYSPIQASGKCKALQEVMLDLERIKATGARVVRLYSTDCNVLEAIEPTTKKARKTYRALAKQRKIEAGVKLDAVVGLFPYVDGESAREGKKEHMDKDDSASTSAKWFPSLDDQLQDLSRWGLWSRVTLLSVGSGGVFDGSYSRADLVAMIRHVKRELLVSHGQPHVKVTTAEPVQSYVSTLKFNAQDVRAYTQYRRGVSMSDAAAGAAGPAQDDDDLCAAVDVVGLAVQPFFNAAVAPESAGALVQRDLKFVEYLCSDLFIGSARAADSAKGPATQRKLAPASPDADSDADSGSDSYNKHSEPPQDTDKELVVMEAGWPSQGLENGEAVPGVEEQLVAISSILKARNPRTGKAVPVALYTFEDEMWREPGLLSVETHFGVSRLF